MLGSLTLAISGCARPRQGNVRFSQGEVRLSQGDVRLCQRWHMIEVGLKIDIECSEWAFLYDIKIQDWLELDYIQRSTKRKTLDPVSVFEGP